MKVRVGLLLAAIAAAIVGGVVGWRLTESVEIAITTGIAVYRAALATLAQVWSAIVDRPDLDVTVRIDVSGSALEVRLNNSGGRAAPIDEMGLWPTKSGRAQMYPEWHKDSPRITAMAIPGTIMPHAASVVAVDWLRSVARWYVEQGVPRWIFVRPPQGRLRWWPLPADVQAVLAGEMDAVRQELQLEMGQPTADDFGNPLPRPYVARRKSSDGAGTPDSSGSHDLGDEEKRRDLA